MARGLEQRKMAQDAPLALLPDASPGLLTAPISSPAKPVPRRLLARHLWLALTLPAVIFLLVTFAYPLLRILLRSLFDPDLTSEHYSQMIGTPAYLRVLLTTFQISIIVTLLSLLLGYPVAFALTKLHGVAASLLIAGIVLPLWTSELVRSFAWTIILGRQGPLNEMLERLGIIERPIGLLFNAPAVYIGATHIMLPFMILPLYSVMRGIDPRLSQAAMSMGATPFRAFRTVFLPLSMPGVVSGCLLVFVLATGFFVTPSILGSENETMIAMLIETEARRSLNWGMASALAVALLASTGIILAIYDRIFGLDRLQVSGTP
jgi:putative spermidine/putrescine transport system permease protein